MKKITLFVSTLILAACGATKLITITQADVDRAATKYPGITSEQLVEGQKLYAANCAKCHTLFAPGKYSEKKWNHEIPQMSGKQFANIDAKTQESITKYILTFAKQ